MVVGFLDRNAVACQFFGPVRSAVKSGFLASLLQAPMLAPGVLVERRVEFTAGRPKIQEKVLMASGMPDIALDASASAFTRAAARRMFANKSFGQLVMKFRRYGEGIGFGVLVAVEATTYPVGGKIGNV